MTLVRHERVEHEDCGGEASGEWCPRCRGAARGACHALQILEPEEVDSAAPGLYSSAALNPPSGEDCVAVILHDSGELEWADESGCGVGGRWRWEE